MVSGCLIQLSWRGISSRDGGRESEAGDREQRERKHLEGMERGEGKSGGKERMEKAEGERRESGSISGKRGQ